MSDEAALVGRTETRAREARSFPIVGVGASAGGLDSFRRLLGELPHETEMAYVFVQHLDPTHESILTTLLSQVTQMVVTEVTTDVVVEPNNVYVIPPSRDLVFKDGSLKLIARGSVGTAHLPIDSLLLSLAEEEGNNAIGVILSGMGSDGALGLAAIHSKGGVTLVQEPSTAKHDEMPRSALAGGQADFILSPEEIAHELILIGEQFKAERGARTASNHTPPEVASDAGDEGALTEILEGLRKASGTSFGSYKKSTLRRRIARRMALTRIETPAQYARYLEENPDERNALYEDCLISVTSFFRDPEVFQALTNQVAPLLEARATDTPFRIWVPGCATGEEAYSIAMCLLESRTELVRKPILQIFATDLSERALSKAREGLYTADAVRSVQPDRLRRFFVKVGDHYRISKSVREMCVFARHDLTRDPPYSHLDLISCRNVLIYLEPALQEMVLSTFHYALRPGGVLLLGPAETATGAAGLFAPLDEPNRLYARKEGRGPARVLAAHRETSPTWTAFDPPARKTSRGSDVSREADRVLLARFGPPSVLVDDNYNVLEFRGDTGPFLDHGHGKASLNLERLLRRGLMIELREIVAEVKATGAAVRRGGLHVRNRKQLQSVTIEVVPLKGRASPESCLLILFEAEGAAVEVSAPPNPQPGDTRDREIERLSDGLVRATDYMHTLLREHETTVAELQSTTEEALSSNEELQSLNEELQTAKEEIQSTNEELATLNQELHDRNAQLARSNEDILRGLDRANALVDTVPVPLLILDLELRVEMANLTFYDTFRTSPGRTRNRLLAELGNGQWNEPRLLSGIEELIAHGTILQELTIEAEFPHVGERTMFLSARRIHGEPGARERVLLAIEDRTAIMRAERGQEALFALEQQARRNAEAADQLKDQFVATVSHELRGPLSVISGWVDVLTADSKVHEAGTTLVRALAALRRGVTTQKRLITELLDHSRFVMGRVVLERTPIDLVTIAETSLVGVRAAAQAKDIAISLSHDSPTCLVLGDEDRMQQVIWNLVFNAVKFTPPKGRISISIARTLNQVQLTVSDTGIGIAPAFLPHVFERFRQAEGATNRSQAGLGLGLKLVNELVELHGGTVHAHSAGLGCGSTFVVVLPVPALMLAAASGEFASPVDGSARAPLSEPPESLPHLSRDVLAGIKLLVVDDEPDACDALVGLLERYGAQVRSATSVNEAMGALVAQLPDVLISDLGLALDDGFELVRRVRLLPADAGGQLPALAVSAYAKETHRPKALEAGFQEYLEKPVAPTALMRAVARLMPVLDHPGNESGRVVA